MKKVELLSPAGNKQMLISAINSGADAIYLAGKKYGARKFAANFSNAEIVDAIKYAHLYGVKVYVTINTLIYEDEIDSFLEYVKFLYQNNVDAVLMQDLGMINLVRKIYPNLEVHASTQMHNHNIEGIKYLHDIGVKRVVLARELSLQEIKDIGVPIEKEVFVYGALCISYSGQCLMSSCLLNRSGNRGECAGMCRLPYKLYENNQYIETDGEYLLSPKELNVLTNLREVLDSGVDSLKIEGRMKSPEYVAYVTRLFRRLIDNYYNNEVMNITDEEMINLKKLYNREFTLGHLFNEKNYNLMNIKSSNHIGTHLGKARIYRDKIKICLDDYISQGDGIRFGNNQGMFVNYLYDKDFLLINSAEKNDIVYVDNKVGLKNDCEVLKTLDKRLIEQISDIPSRRVNININIIAKIGLPLKATITDNNYFIEQELGLVEKSKTAPIKKSEIVDRFSKLNDTPFRLVDINIEADDNIFIPVRIMNELRRNIVSSLMEKRIQPTKDIIIEDYKPSQVGIKRTKTINVLVRNENQLKYLINKNVNIYVTDLLLYKKYKQKNVFFVTDRVSEQLNDFIEENLLASNLSSVIKYSHSNNVFSSIYVNVTNSYTLKVLHDLKVKKIGLSIENSIDNIQKMIKGFYKRYKEYPNVDVLVFGRVELMVMKHCFLNMFINKETACNICKNNKQYYLKDRNSKTLPILNRNCKTYILNHQNLDLLSRIGILKEMNITNFSISLFDETQKAIDYILKQLNI